MELKNGKNQEIKDGIKRRITELVENDSITKVAKELNMTRQGVHVWTSKTRNVLPSAAQIVLLSEYFGVTTDYILKGKK